MRRLVYVTGAGRGIGQAMAVELARAGYQVAACARSRTELEQTQALGGRERISIASVDVSDHEALSRWIASEAKDATLQPWGLVTAAGTQGPIGSLAENDWEQWKKGVEVNLYGTAAAVKIFSSLLLARKLPGRIVLLSGGGATKPMPNFSNYAATKAAVVRFGETIAHELAAHGITVNSVAPGAINTRLLDDVLQAGPDKAGRDNYERALKQKQAGGQGSERAAALCVYLLDERTDKITGRLISAIWDPWETLRENAEELSKSEVYTLRRLLPEHLT